MTSPVPTHRDYSMKPKILRKHSETSSLQPFHAKPSLPGYMRPTHSSQRRAIKHPLGCRRHSALSDSEESSHSSATPSNVINCPRSCNAVTNPFVPRFSLVLSSLAIEQVAVELNHPFHQNPKSL